MGFRLCSVFNGVRKEPDGHSEAQKKLYKKLYNKREGKLYILPFHKPLIIKELRLGDDGLEPPTSTV